MAKSHIRFLAAAAVAAVLGACSSPAMHMHGMMDMAGDKTAPTDKCAKMAKMKEGDAKSAPMMAGKMKDCGMDTAAMAGGHSQHTPAP